jgi:transposase
MAKQKTTSNRMDFSLVNPQAAGIDVGSRSHWVSIGTSEGQTREYGVFTEDLHTLCQWLKSEGIRTVALESTGFYWKQLFLMLQSYGMEACLVNASYTKNVQGRKPSDLADSQWIWKLHSVGLLTASFQPDFFTEELRTYTRHRKRLIEDASRCANKMQKCLILMNIQLPVVISDITGKSGTAIIEAILGGERDGKKLAALADGRLRADKATLARALTGFWQECQLFELEQHWQTYHHYQRQLALCDGRIDALLRKQVETTGQAELVHEPKKKQRSKNSPSFKVEEYAYQLSDGVDLLQVEGISFDFILTLLAEVGMDLSQFPTAKHFASWLCLSPNKKVSGGKVLSSKTRKSKHRLRQAFRRAALGASNRKGTPLSHFYHRMAYSQGKGTAITATARKLAIIVYNMVQKRQPYRPQQLEQYQEKVRTQKIKQIQRTIEKLEVKKNELSFA